VEWVRTCFSSKWRLFRDRPDLLTSGRYVRCPPGTPFYTGWTNLWSRDWVSDELDPWPELGEYDGPRAYDKGIPLSPAPFPVVLGKADCIENGELPGEEGVIEFGFPPGCFLPAIPVFPEIVPQTRQFILNMARVVEALYFDPDQAGPLLELFTGATTSTTWATTVGGTPSGVVAVVNGEAFVVLGGTDNNGDLILQIFQGFPPPASFGAYSTLPIWQSAALTWATRLEGLGIDPNKRICLFGHSYGGAVAAVMAARFRVGIDEREIVLRTFGMPVPGDFRLAELLSNTDRQHIATIGDFVTLIPSSLLVRSASLLSFWAVWIFRLEYWEHPSNQWLLYSTGALVQDDSNAVFSLPAIAAIATDLFLGIPVAAPLPHAIAAYIARLELPP